MCKAVTPDSHASMISPAGNDDSEVKFSIALQKVPSIFEASDCSKYSLTEEIIADCKEQGLVAFYKFKHSYHQYPSCELKGHIERILKKSSASIHYCFVWKTLQSVGFELSRRFVLKAMIYLAGEKKARVRQVSLKEFEFIH